MTAERVPSCVLIKPVGTITTRSRALSLAAAGGDPEGAGDK